MNIDVVIPIKTSIIDQAIKYTIPSIFSYFQYRRIYVITKSENFLDLQRVFGDKIGYIDEDKVCEGLTFNTISDYFKQRGAADNPRKGWYLQQFIKFGVAKIDFISEYYLIWDADVVLLRPLNVFSSSGKVLYDAILFYHKPHFDVTDKFLHLKRQKTYSFIAEHMVFKKEIVLKIMDEIANQVSNHWWLGILDSFNAEKLEVGGFSEYEMYGTYVSVHYPKLYKLRKLAMERPATRYCTMNPTPFELKLFSWRYDLISLETVDIPNIFVPFAYRRFRLFTLIGLQMPSFIKKIIWYIKLEKATFILKVKSEEHKLHKLYLYYRKTKQKIKKILIIIKGIWHR